MKLEVAIQKQQIPPKYYPVKPSVMNPASFDNAFISAFEKGSGKEYLLTNREGSYCASTISGCNTRKYHGLFVAPQPQIDDQNHILVSAVDEEITYKKGHYQLSTHQYPDTLYPAGYKLIEYFEVSPIPKWIYAMQDCRISKEILMPENEKSVLIRYTVLEASEKVQFKFAPLLAFRNVHSLKKADATASTKTQTINYGISVQLFTSYDSVYIQSSSKMEFTSDPNWYYNVEYLEEQKRGYDYKEDLFVPGYFTRNMKKGDKITISISLNDYNPKILNNAFTAVLKKKPVINTEKDALLEASKHFIIKSGNKLNVKAGYYWFDSWGRDTFISLPGLTLVTGRFKEFKEIIRSLLPDLKYGLFPNVGSGKKNASYNSVDASLWFIWSIQQYGLYTNTRTGIWEEYGKYMKRILQYYSQGTLHNIKMTDDGLIYAGQEGLALTWMDAVVDGKPVTPRIGKAVEINALWYNAVCFCVEMARLSHDQSFIAKWKDYPEKIQHSFMETFSDNEHAHLADCVNHDVKDWSLRPNQIFALSLPYSPVPFSLRKSILRIMENELLTPKGLRTLSPNDKNYKGKCEGGQATRDSAYHQGTIWPWLLGHFAEAYLKTNKEDGPEMAEHIFQGCSAMLRDQCLHTVPEIYNGDLPHLAVGAVSQAWSVAELLRIEHMLEKILQNRTLQVETI